MDKILISGVRSYLIGLLSVVHNANCVRLALRVKTSHDRLSRVLKTSGGRVLALVSSLILKTLENFSNCRLAVFAVETGVEGNRNVFERDAETILRLFELFNRGWQQDRVMCVYARSDAGDKAITGIVSDINGFFASLVFVPRVADSRAPFLATTFEPSP